MIKAKNRQPCLRHWPPPNKILEIEVVDRMDKTTEERENEGVDSETEGMNSYNKGVDNEVLAPEWK